MWSGCVVMLCTSWMRAGYPPRRGTITVRLAPSLADAPAGRYVAFEGEVFERVVFGAHGQPVVFGAVGEPAGERPRKQDAVMLEPEIPVEAPGVVFLHHEPVAGHGTAGTATGFRRAVEGTPLAVFLESLSHHVAWRCPPGRGC